MMGSEIAEPEGRQKNGKNQYILTDERYERYNEYSVSARKKYKKENDIIFRNMKKIMVFLKIFYSWSQTCNCKKGSDWLKRWVEAQHNIF